MIRVFIFIFTIVLLGTAQAATSGGKGKLGSVADSGHGSTGGGGSSNTGRMPRDPRNAPPLDERRKVSEQDCSKPIDPQAGNLRCK